MKNGMENAVWQMKQKEEDGLNYIYSQTYNFVYLRAKSILKNEEDIKWIKKAAKINNEILDMVGEKIHAGMSTEEIDQMVYDYTVSHGAIPACLDYMGFPKSCCTSVNNEICHGIPDKNVILKVARLDICRLLLM